MKKAVWRCTGIFGLLLPLGACQVPSGEPHSWAEVPVETLRPSTKSTQGKHLVSWGENLDSVARLYGQKPEALASRNGLKPPYRLESGQWLALEEGPQPTASPWSESPPVQQRPKEIPPPPEPQPVIARASSPEPVIPIKEASPPVSPKAWIRPVQGPLLAGYNQQGVDFGGQLGAPVMAAKAGKVVYQGVGIRGYGKLVIIKHEAGLLSAYAHNEAILVKEGQQVDRGQVIAQMGKTPNNQVKLHFEIRKEGKPVNPLAYLPKT